MWRKHLRRGRYCFLTEEEYNEAEACMEELGIVDGYTQEADSSDAVYIPAFNGAGVREPSKEEF